MSGSLREASKNTVALRAFEGEGFVLFEGLGALPHFNPDLDVAPFPLSVLEWRAALQGAEAVVNLSPTSHHGHESLVETLTVMMAGVSSFACVAEAVDYLCQI